MENQHYSKLVCGVGRNDLNTTTDNGTRSMYYVWRGILRRCYINRHRNRDDAYLKCDVCEEWLTLSNFKEFYDKHHYKGWQLDKDLLVKGNTIYSPKTCVFLPAEINQFVVASKIGKSGLPIGVTKNKYGRFKAECSEGGKSINLGTYGSIEEAREVYVKAKRLVAHRLAHKWRQWIEPRAYEALLNYNPM